MDVAFRVYAFDENENLHRVGKDLYSGLANGTRGVRELSDQTIRIAYVQISKEQDTFTKIDRINSERWRLDRDGYLDRKTREKNREKFRLIMNRLHSEVTPESGDSTVVDFSSVFRERQVQNTLSWEPTSSEVTKIVNDIWPETAGKPVERAKYIMPTERKLKPLTRNARQFILDLSDPMYKISNMISRQSDSDLRGLVDHLMEEMSDPYEKGGDKVVAGVLDAIRYEQAVRKAKGRKSGIWYAQCEVRLLQSEGYWQIDNLEHKRCDGRDEAEKEAAEMLKRHAHLFSATQNIEVNIVPEIEWAGE